MEILQMSHMFNLAKNFMPGSLCDTSVPIYLGLRPELREPVADFGGTVLIGLNCPKVYDKLCQTAIWKSGWMFICLSDKNMGVCSSHRKTPKSLPDNNVHLAAGEVVSSK